ncbi:SAM-dependent methyltransferase [Symbiobacterium terraclitae]|uniref:SAM-dependent methyltransferase n=1 Tax=Symbiobacterium terraclitae TaxID=557451 RepID=A0ABS4JTA8_9FIRM|nr:class I SAM-dependent methyltransferase [Symbiobacterium terraclitae]MBP2018779.1 SAM-dependent methyltransferase [Symbiobacterium terraclitae]
MRLATRILLSLNRFFRPPVHPFNLANQGTMRYADWQFERGHLTLEHYRPFLSPEEIMKGKTVLDIGSGAGGKTLYYATLGVKKIYGVDIVPHYEEEARAMAEEKGLSDRAEFLTADATRLPFPGDFFDVIIANDVMEHVAEPEAVLREAHRVLKPGGLFFTNFPPYYHPYGAHLSDVIGIPWVHAFFSEPVLIEAYRELVRDLPDAEMRLSLRLGDPRTNSDRLTYINHMTIRRFRRIVAESPFQVAHWRLVPLRSFLRPLAALAPEFFMKAVVCILKK